MNFEPINLNVADYPAVRWGHAQAKQHLANYGDQAFASEFCTSGILLPRQYGKSRELMRTVQAGDYVFHRNHDTVKMVMRENPFEQMPGVKHLSMGQNLDCLRGTRPLRRDFVTFWFDEPDFDKFKYLRATLVTTMCGPMRLDLTKTRFVVVGTLI